MGALTVILSGTGFTATGATILNGSVNSVGDYATDHGRNLHADCQCHGI